jgi:hypothetical protein
MTNALENDRIRNATRQALASRIRSRRIAAAALIIGGLVVVWGSFSTWVACPKKPCEGDFGLFVIYERSGVDFGPGIITAVLGLLLAVLGIYALLNLDRVVRPRLAIVAAAAVLATIGAHLFRIQVIDDFPIVGAPDLGLYITALGGLVALVAGVRQWRVRNLDPPRVADTAQRHLE